MCFLSFKFNAKVAKKWEKNLYRTLKSLKSHYQELTVSRIFVREKTQEMKSYANLIQNVEISRFCDLLRFWVYICCTFFFPSTQTEFPFFYGTRSLTLHLYISCRMLNIRARFTWKCVDFLIVRQWPNVTKSLHYNYGFFDYGFFFMIFGMIRNIINWAGTLSTGFSNKVLWIFNCFWGLRRRKPFLLTVLRRWPVNRHIRACRRFYIDENDKI